MQDPGLDPPAQRGHLGDQRQQEHLVSEDHQFYQGCCLNKERAERLTWPADASLGLDDAVSRGPVHARLAGENKNCWLN